MTQAGRTTTGHDLRRHSIASGNEAPVGVLDSGLGGLSVVRSILALLPSEDIVYFADSAFCPYGMRDVSFIRDRTFAIVDQMIRQGIKLLVVACNTACAVALVDLRERFAIPIIGLEPAVKPAVQLSHSRRIAVLATPRTIASDRLRRLIQTYASGLEVDLIPAPGWVELVEQGVTNGDRADKVVRPLVQPAIEAGCDVLVLGCTHYPFLVRAIQRIAGDDVQVIDSGPAIARRVHFLLENGPPGPADLNGPGTLAMLTTGDEQTVSGIATNLLSTPLIVEQVSV